MSRAMRYRIRHLTRYEYAADVAHAHHLLHLVPRPTPWQQCLEHTLSIGPAPGRRREELDAFGNPVTRVELGYPHRELEVVTRMEVQVHPRPAVNPAETHPWERVSGSLTYNGSWPPRDNLDVCRFRHESVYVRLKGAFRHYAADCFEPGRPVLAVAAALMEKLHRDFRYAPGETTIATPLLEVLEKRHGVCQDFTHLMIACLRSWGLAARYVSGYIRSRPAATPGVPATAAGAATVESAAAAATDTADAGGAPDGEPAPLIGGGASHAWVAVYSPPFGWIELDPTNDLWVGTDHVAVAWGRDFGDVSPLRGIILGGGSHRLTVDVAVEPSDFEPDSHG